MAIIRKDFKQPETWKVYLIVSLGSHGVCVNDMALRVNLESLPNAGVHVTPVEIGRASCRERV